MENSKKGFVSKFPHNDEEIDEATDEAGVEDKDIDQAGNREPVPQYDEEDKFYMHLDEISVDDSSLDSNDPDYYDWLFTQKFAITRDEADEERLADIVADASPKMATMVKEFVKELKDERKTLDGKIDQLQSIIRDKDEIIDGLIREVESLKKEKKESVNAQCCNELSLEARLFCVSLMGSLLGAVVGRNLTK